MDIYHKYVIALVYKNTHAKLYANFPYCYFIVIEKQWNYLLIVLPNVNFVQ